MKKKLFALSILSASLILAAAILNHRTARFDETFSLILICAAASVTVIAAPQRHGCRSDSSRRSP